MALVVLNAATFALGAVAGIALLISFAVSHDAIYLYTSLLLLAAAGGAGILAKLALGWHDEEMAQA